MSHEPSCVYAKYPESDPLHPCACPDAQPVAGPDRRPFLGYSSFDQVDALRYAMRDVPFAPPPPNRRLWLLEALGWAAVGVVILAAVALGMAIKAAQ